MLIFSFGAVYWGAGGGMTVYRAMIAGYHVQFCLIIAQGICPICMELLLSDLVMTDIHTLLASMHTLHFDHFIISLKGDFAPDGVYKSSLYWHSQK